MLRVGLTGGIGSGKSLVADLFARRGVPVIDTDAISHELTRRDGEGTRLLLEHLGHGILDANGDLDRAQLRDRAFADPAFRKSLESILHPLIRRDAQRAMTAASGPYCLVVVPLLFEAGFKDLVDRVLVVDAAESDQIDRVRRRSGLMEEEIRRIMATQLSSSARIARADDVIENCSTMEALDAAVETLHHHYLALASQR
jgi:dephospho-CoA kinase